MNYVLNTITFLLLSVNGDVIYLDHKFDPKKYNCETYYESKTTYFDKSKFHLKIIFLLIITLSNLIHFIIQLKVELIILPKSFIFMDKFN